MKAFGVMCVKYNTLFDCQICLYICISISESLLSLCLFMRFCMSNNSLRRTILLLLWDELSPQSLGVGKMPFAQWFGMG